MRRMPEGFAKLNSADLRKVSELWFKKLSHPLDLEISLCAFVLPSEKEEGTHRKMEES